MTAAYFTVLYYLENLKEEEDNNPRPVVE